MVERAKAYLGVKFAALVLGRFARRGAILTGRRRGWSWIIRPVAWNHGGACEVERSEMERSDG